MNKIKELIDSVDFIEGFTKSDVELIMKAYAEWYAQQVIYKIKQSENKIYHTETGQCSYVIGDDFKLPKHD